MNNSIWNIDEKLQSLIEEIEENGGEFTEEQEQELALTQEKFNNKVESYCAIIDKYQSYADTCKNEKKRINEIQKVRENIITKLKNVLLNAVDKYGIIGKSNNKTFETATRKLFTKTLSSLNVDEERVNILTKYFIEYVNELYVNGVLDGNDEEVLTTIVNVINQIAKSELGDEYQPFNVNDVKSIKINFNIELELSDLLNRPTIIDYIRNSTLVSDFTKNVSKDDVKFLNSIEQDKENPQFVTIANFVNKTSLTIK